MTKKRVSKKKITETIENVDGRTPTIATLLERIDTLEANVDRINKRVVLISDGLKFMADNCRQLFGLAGLAVVIDAITAKFK